jgi:hypothetical protein
MGGVGRPEEFADLASFLLSARASYVTGTAINLDGGPCPVTLVVCGHWVGLFLTSDDDGRDVLPLE